LRLTSIASLALLGAMAMIGILTGPRNLSIWWLSMVVLPLLIACAALPFVVRGYTLENDRIVIKRLGWSSILPLAGLRSISSDVQQLHGSIRIFGNGGLLSFSGWFWNRRLGRYRMFATDPARAVILTYPDRRIVLTPHDPHGFVLRVRKLLSIGEEWRS
jgi:hypothetical protein